MTRGRVAAPDRRPWCAPLLFAVVAGIAGGQLFTGSGASAVTGSTGGSAGCLSSSQCATGESCNAGGCWADSAMAGVTHAPPASAEEAAASFLEAQVWIAVGGGEGSTSLVR